MPDETESPATEGFARPGRRVDWRGVLRWVVFPAAVLAVILGALIYIDQHGGDGGATDDAYGVVQLPAGKNPTDSGPAPEKGRAGPDFLLETPDGGTLRLSDLQGKAVLLNFWASWCPPCRSEMPELVDAYAANKDRGLVIIGVNLQEPASTIRKFADQFGITFPLGIDRDGEVADAWRLGGPIQGLPTSYFIDKTGVVRDFFYGPLTTDSLNKRLAEILPEATS